MKRSLLAAAVLVVFVAGIVSVAAGEDRHAAEGSAHAHSDEPGSSCPDDGADGAPCGPACACACCPGHSVPVLFATGPQVGAVPSPVGRHCAGRPDRYESAVASALFRPPRA